MRGMYPLKAADRTLASLNLLATVSTDVPKRDLRIESVFFLVPLYVCHVEPQMPLHGHHLYD